MMDNGACTKFGLGVLSAPKHQIAPVAQLDRALPSEAQFSKTPNLKTYLTTITYANAYYLHLFVCGGFVVDLGFFLAALAALSRFRLVQTPFVDYFIEMPGIRDFG